MDPVLRDDAEWESVLAAIVADGPLDTAPLDDEPSDDGLSDDGLSDDELPRGAPRVPDLGRVPGVGLVRSLRDTDPSALSPADVIAYVQATERTIAWLGALQADALVACAGERSGIDHYEIPDARVISIEDAARSEISAATRWSEAWAHERIVTARLLAGPLSDTGAALRDGLITLRHADVLAAAAQRLGGYGDWADGADQEHPGHPAVRSFLAACSALQDATLAKAQARGVPASRKAVERALLRIDAEHAQARRRAERRSRDVYVVAEPDGMALLIARMGLAQAHACLSVVDGIARDPRLPLPAGTPADAGIGERRAEALAHLLLATTTGAPSSASTGASTDGWADASTGASTDGWADASIGASTDGWADASTGASTDGWADAPTGAPTDGWVPAPVRTHVDVVIDLTSLLGLSEEPGTIRGHGPGGPLPLAAEAIRALVAADATATMRRLVTDPMTGHLLDRGRSTYAIPAALRDFVVTRDGTCRFPGCSRRAGLAQIDHAVPWEQGGTTDRANLGALCIRHHQLKTHAGWTITASADDGSARWRSPAGLSYEHPPPQPHTRE